MHIASLQFSLRLPEVHSLKEKRGQIRPLLDGLRNRFPVSVAEVGFQDKWQRCDIGVAIVSGSASQVEDVLDAVERFVWSFPEFEVLSAERRWFDPD